MPDKNSALQQVYEGLASKNPQLKEYGYKNFSKDMQDENKLNKVYEGLANKNPQLKEYGFDNFKNDMLGGTQEQTQEETTDYGPFDKSMVQRSPRARQNFKRWQKGQTTARQDSVEPAIKPDAAEWKDKRDSSQREQNVAPESKIVGQKISLLEKNIEKRESDQNFFETAFAGDVDTKEYLALNLYKRSKNQVDAVTGSGGTGVGDALKDRNFYTLGATDLATIINVWKISKKKEKGEPLSESEKLLLDAWATNEEVNQKYPLKDAKRGYEVSKKVTDMVPWLAQFAATRGAGTAGRKALEVSLKKGAQKYLGKTIGKYAAKGAGEIAGAYAASALMPQTFAGITERTLGDTKRDAEGNITFDKETAEKNAEAIYKGWTSSMLEVLTERMGEGLGKVIKMPKTKLSGRIIGESGKKVAENFNQFTKAVGWHGAPMEYFEEWVNVPLNALLVGDSEYSDMFDVDQQLTTFLTVIAMGAAMSTPVAGAQQVAKAIDRNKIKKDFKAATDLYESEIGEDTRNSINQIIENNELSIEQQSQELHNILSNTESQEEAGIILNYVANRYRAEGVANTPEQTPEAEQTQEPTDTEQPVDPEGQAPTVDPRQTAEAQLRQDIKPFTHKDGTVKQVFDNRQDAEESQPLFIISGDINDPEGFMVRNLNGETELISDPKHVTTPESFTEDEFVESKLQEFDQEQQAKEQFEANSIVIDGQRHTFVEDGDKVILEPITEEGEPAGERIERTKEEFQEILEKEKANREQPAETAEGQPQEQPEPEPVIREKIGKQTYEFTENEDGTLDVILPENEDAEKTLQSLEKEFQDNPDWQVVAEKEVVEVPPESRFQRPTQQTVIKKIQIAPKNEQNVSEGTSGENKTSENEQQFTFGNEAISKEEAAAIITEAETPEDLANLNVPEGDKEISALLEEKFPAPKPVYKANGKKITPEQAKAKIRLGKLEGLVVENDPEVLQLYEQKARELGMLEEETAPEVSKNDNNIYENEKKLTETKSQTPEQQQINEISEAESLQNREEVSETGEERLQNWWEEYDVVNEITDFSGQKQQGEWIKIANAYFPLSEVQKYNSKDELLAAKLKEGETQQQSTDVQENLTTEQEGVKETELTPEETEIYNQAKTVVDNSLKNTTPEEMQKAKTGSGFAAAKFAMRYTSPEKNQRLYNAIYNLYFDAVKNYPTEQVSGNLTNETTKAEQPENRGKEATKKTFKLPIEKNLEQAEERVEKKKQDNEAIKSATKTPRTVRELADLEAEKQQGLISGVVLSALKEGDTFKVGRNKTYTVTRKTKPKKVEYSREKHSGQYDRTTVTITDNEGKKYTYELWDNWIQDGNKMVSTIHRKGATPKSDMVGQLSMDIEGDINLDLINENNRLHEKTDSYKIIEKELNRINKEQPEVDEEVGNKTPEQKPETPENQSEPQQEVGSNVGINEYKYHLRSRPFSIGTYPQNDNFVRHEEDNTPFGKVIYSEPLSIEDVKKFELVPEGQVEAGDYVMSLGNNEYPVRVEVVKNQKGQDAVKLTNEENGFNQNMSAVDFMEQLQEGKFIKAPQNKPESKFLDDKVEQAGKKKPKRKSFTQQVKKGLNEKEIDRLDELRNKLRNKLGGQLNAGLDPETFMMAAEATGLVIKSGMRQFSDYASSMVDLLGNKIKPHLKALYEYTKRADSAEFIDKMTPTNEVDNADIDEILQQPDESNVNLDNENNQQDVSDRTGNSEQDSGRNADDVRPDQNDVPSDRGRSGNTGTSNQGTGRTGNQKQEGSQGRIDLFTPTDGERSDSGISEKDEGLQSETENAGNTDTERGSDNRTEGNNDERTGNHSDRGSNQKDNKSTKSFAERVKENLKKQKAAENVPVKPTNRENISETLPFLLEEQQDDVYKAEKRYYNPDQKTHEKAYGKGMLFTNGTGTGKTYTGLGVIKRFIKQGKNRILIVVPSQPKVSDWIEDAKNLNINVNGLKDTQDKGEGVVITTYANMRANMKLMEEDFDLVVYDESHRLMEDKNGNPSSTTYAHYNISNKSKDQALARLKMVHPLWKKELDLEKQIRREGERRANPDLMEEMYQESLAKEKELEAELKEVNEQQKKVLPDLEKRAQKAYENTKVLFLSATPFKMHFNLRYANGYLYDWGEEITYESASRGQSRVDAESRFFLDNFGSAYEWKYHRLQKKSDANPQAVAMQEAEFAEKLMKSGAMSGRAIESEQDYSREFPLVALDKSELINRAYSDIYNYSTKEFSELTTAAGEVFHNYNYTTKLFESLKTSMVLPRVKEHIKLGRKVVLFHRRRQSGVAPPFQTVLNTTRINAKFVLNDPDSNQKSKDQAEEALRQADAFEEKYGELLEYEQNLNYNSAIDQVVEEFGVDRVRFINGTVSKKDKNKAVIDFNNDNSGVDIIVVQEEAGKEGISLHDTTGKHQRVEISLSMPISSITALQMEGRIYRIGQETDAIFEYPLLGLDLEVAYFGQNINRRLSTTENLAVGNQSRDLIRSFAEGVLFNSSADSPNVEQGKGGKEYDKKEVELQSEFQRARLVYQTNQKQRGRRDQRKGIDYYPTPEPVGQKMVEWLGLESGETGLEPSAGHGAIAMWFPDRAKVTAIEPAYGLYSKLTARVGGAEPKVINDTFENHHVVNKYDGIAMNPPFGQGGKTAMDHIEKAFSHLREGGRIVAIVPNGGSMQKRLDKFFAAENDKGKLVNPDAVLKAEIEMPGVMFDQAGTKINSKIIVIDKVPIKSERQIRDEVRRESNQRALDGGALMTLEEISQEVDRRMRAQIANREWTYPSHDFKDIENINELFDVIEDLELPERTKPEGSSQPQAGPAVTEQNTDKPKYEIFEQKHSQTGEDLFMAMPTEYLGKDTFRELKQLAKKHDGYYSSYQNKANNVKRGFTFKSEESRNKFVAEAQKDDTGIRLRVSEPLYSPTERALERIKQEKGTPEQFKSMLLKNGAKQAELDWMGFDEFSQDKKSLTKQEIQEWIDGNKVEIKEVEKSVPEEQTSTAEFTPEAEERYEELKLIRDKWEFANEIADYNKEELTPTQKRNINEWEEEFESWDNLVDNIIPDFESNNENYKTDTGDTKYSQYQLPGGPLSRDTEILTQFGWVRMDKIQKGDIVLSRKDEGGVLEWVPVEDVPTVYSEKLYHFKSQSVDMMVTPNHQMVVEKRVGDKNHRRRIIQRMTASDLWNTWDCRIPLMGEWEGKHVEEIFGLPAGDVMEFMGWYISEGWAKICRKTGNKSTIGIGQSREKNPKKSQRIEQLLNRLGFSWSYSANGMQYYVGVKSVPQQLRKMCYSLGKAEEKFIPNELFQYSKPLLKRLHESMILGDGHIAICKKGIRKNKANYFTISKKLADDFQILTLQIGLRGKILIRKSNEVQKNDLYCVAVNTKPYATVDDAKHAIVNYNDIAYCVTVKNHAIYVRRNGTAAWTGNSNYREIVMTMPATYDVNPFTGEKSTFAKSDKNYKSSHWEEANPIAHVRIKDYTDTEQRKLLHAEEIQADKGQEWLKLKRKINAGTATKEDIARFEFLDNNFPFNKTTEWLNLALRRLAVYAAENGYDGISWTPGEQQAERYDLSKQVESITATPTENGKFVFIDMISNHNATLNVDSDGKIIEDKNNLPGDQSFMGKNLDDIVRKDISEKILKVNEETKLEGEDLKVGGEGQVVFYDKIIPAQANKIFKKFGAKTQQTTINLNEGNINPDLANDAVMNLPEDGKLDVMYIPVTEKFKKVATEQGMPLFKDTESQFITDRIHNNKLKALFQKYFENAKNTGTIHVVTSPQEVPAEFRQKQTLKGTQGFYDVNTGETYFITGNIKDGAEAFKTWVHEVGVHRGLSNIIPPAELNRFFQKIYDDIGSEEIKANIPESYHELDPTVQAEEYLAFLGEKVVNEKDLTPKQKGMWQKIVDTVKNILNKLFTGARFTNKDAENVVKAAVQSVYQPPITPNPTNKGRFLDDVVSQGKKNPDIRMRKVEEKPAFLDELLERITQENRLKKKEAELKEKINTEPKKKETHYNHTLIKKKIQAIKMGYRLGVIDTKKNIKKLQNEIVQYAKENMPLDDAGKADIGKVLTLIRDANSIKKLEDAFEKITELTSGMEARVERNKHEAGIKRLLGYMTGFKKEGNQFKGKFNIENVREFQNLKEVDKKATELSRIVRSNNSHKEEIDEANNKLNELWETLNKKEGKTIIDNVAMRMVEYRRFGAKASNELVESIHEDLSIIYNAAKEAKTIEDIHNAIELNEQKEFVKQFIDEPMSKHKKFKQFLKKTDMSVADIMGNWETLMTILGGHKARDKFTFILNQIDQTVGTQGTINKVLDKAQDIYGFNSKTKTLNYLHDLSDERYTLVKPIRKRRRGEGEDLKLSKLHLMDIYNAIQNPEIREDYYRSYGDASSVEAIQRATGKMRIDELVGNLSKQDIELAKVMQEEVDKYYPAMNKAFVRLYNRDLPKVENYWPSSAERESDIDLAQQYYIDSKHPGATKERATYRTPTPKNAFNKFTKHVKDAEWYANMAIPITEVNNIFKDRDVKDKITEALGETFYKNINEALANIGLNPPTKMQPSSNLDDALNFVLNNWVTAKIGLTPSVPLKQLLSVINYAENMPFTKWASGFVKSMVDPVSTWKEMMEIPYLKTRLGAGYSEALHRALGSDNFVLRSKTGNFHQAVKNLQTIGTRYGDIAAIIFGGKPYLDYLMNEKGLSEKEAVDKFLLDTLRSQQSPLSSTLSKFQNSKNAIYRSMFAFSNTPSQYMRKLYESRFALEHGDISRNQFNKIWTIYSTLNSASFVVVGALISALLSATDPWDEIWKKIAAQFGTTLVGGLPVINNIAEIVTRESLGMTVYADVNPIVESIGKGLQEFVKYTKGIGSADKSKNKHLKNSAKYLLEAFGISAGNAVKVYEAITKRPELNYEQSIETANEYLRDTRKAKQNMDNAEEKLVKGGFENDLMDSILKSKYKVNKKKYDRLSGVEEYKVAKDIKKIQSQIKDKQELKDEARRHGDKRRQEAIDADIENLMERAVKMSKILNNKQ